jgi:hypothetical protein
MAHWFIFYECLKYHSVSMVVSHREELIQCIVHATLIQCISPGTYIVIKTTRIGIKLVVPPDPFVGDPF